MQRWMWLFALAAAFQIPLTAKTAAWRKWARVQVAGYSLENLNDVYFT